MLIVIPAWANCAELAAVLVFQKVNLMIASQPQHPVKPGATAEPNRYHQGQKHAAIVRIFAGSIGGEWMK
jgi:hypothetical protein